MKSSKTSRHEKGDREVKVSFSVIFIKEINRNIHALPCYHKCGEERKD